MGVAGESEHKRDIIRRINAGGFIGIDSRCYILLHLGRFDRRRGDVFVCESSYFRY